MAALAAAAAFAGLLLALVPVVGADTDAAGGNAAPCLGFLVGIRCVSDVWCALGSCSCGSWGPLHLLHLHPLQAFWIPEKCTNIYHMRWPEKSLFISGTKSSHFSFFCMHAVENRDL